MSTTIKLYHKKKKRKTIHFAFRCIDQWTNLPRAFHVNMQMARRTPAPRVSPPPLILQERKYGQQKFSRQKWGKFQTSGELRIAQWWSGQSSECQDVCDSQLLLGSTSNSSKTIENSLPPILFPMFLRLIFNLPQQPGPARKRMILTQTTMMKPAKWWR